MFKAYCPDIYTVVKAIKPRQTSNFLQALILPSLQIDKGGYGNSSRLKIWTFSLHHGAFWPYFVWNTNFNYCRFYIYAQWWLLSIITNFKFCMTFFMLSWFNLKYFGELENIAIIAVFCKITCRIWILMHGMNPAILFLVFFTF